MSLVDGIAWEKENGWYNKPQKKASDDTFDDLVDVLIKDIQENKTQYSQSDIIDMLNFVKAIHKINMERAMK